MTLTRCITSQICKNVCYNNKTKSACYNFPKNVILQQCNITITVNDHKPLDPDVKIANYYSINLLPLLHLNYFIWPINSIQRSFWRIKQKQIVRRPLRSTIHTKIEITTETSASQTRQNSILVLQQSSDSALISHNTKIHISELI